MALATEQWMGPSRRVSRRATPRHNELRTVVANAGELRFGGHEDGPIMHTGGLEPITAAAEIVLYRSRGFSNVRRGSKLRSMTTKRILHAFKLSGHAHRVELFLSILGLAYERNEVDLVSGAHKVPEFLAKNPFGQVPVLEDSELTIADSNAILVYLSSKYDSSGKWYPRDPIVAARIQRWLSVAAGELQRGPGAARLAVLFGAKLDHEHAKQVARGLFDIIEQHLAATPYLVGAAPTIADIALYSYTAVAAEGHVALDPWSNVRAWLTRIEKIPGFVPMHRATVS